jgi:sulfur-carrier protein
MPRVFVPSLMRDLTSRQAQVIVPGTTIRQIIDALDAAYPGARARLCSGDDICAHLAVVVDGQASALGLQQSVLPDSEVHFVPAIHGGK